MNILDFIFPKDLYCISCERPLSGREDGIALCSACEDEIFWVTGRCCEKCGRPLAEGNRTEFCSDCGSGMRHAYRRGYASVIYAGPVREMVRDMKYRDKAWHAETLASLMAGRYKRLADPETGELPYHDYIMPVPMNAKKKAKRGYDQAALIARGLSVRIGVPYLGGAIIRVRETKVMSSLTEEERRQNLRGAFAVPCDMIRMIAGKSIMLVDDVYTTGSSTGACAEVLLTAGAESVDVFVFATKADARCTEDRPAVVESPGQLRAKGPT